MQPITDALQASIIRQQLGAATQWLHDIQVFAELDSTNRWMLQQGQCGEVCLAERQTAGRGRRGRQWESPEGVNLYLSLRWCFAQVPKNLPILSLVTGLAVVDALEDCAITGHGLKWPNDVYYAGRKLGGILLEAVGSLEQIVIGIGLNVNMLPETGAAIDQPWVSLREIHGAPMNRNTLASVIIERLLARLQTFPQLDVAQFQQEWQRRDVLDQRPVRVLSGSHVSEGVACGVDSQGQLQVRLRGGSIKTFSSADVSVRM
ncbi:MAG: biotin--[acetyl-CoA-carboxylase] ligase [Gammaproteobacteria bacterium]|nr:biotin--[acetyl-CoA-carboxylase] ligase [Gammaproteobacteria bacterium]MBU1724093.1 biotin--[acetyl-CoA-carboxylase] ligase [Gammaproteobacteria bacterium]MBU2006831.1 biotin--[acetyl-CoA-carboxylase] ligase [Gammaproteobacteria bacterium]